MTAVATRGSPGNNDWLRMSKLKAARSTSDVDRVGGPQMARLVLITAFIGRILGCDTDLIGLKPPECMAAV